MTSEDKERLDWLWNTRDKHDINVAQLLHDNIALKFRLDFPPDYKIGDVTEKGTVIGMEIDHVRYNEKGEFLKYEKHWKFKVLTKEGREIFIAPV